MIDLSRRRPPGFGEKRWWLGVAVLAVLLGLALLIDRPLSLWAQSAPKPVHGVMVVVTRYGESDWILYPSAILYVVTVFVALLARWKLMRTMLWQFAALYAFIFLGVGLPGLFTTLVKRLIGRGRPMHFEDTGLFGLHWNWLDWTYQSFPSGHAATAFALAMTIGFLSRRWFYPALLYALAVVASRLILGVHYPSDVLAGAMVGVAGAYLVRAVFARRGWAFRVAPDGRIAPQPMSSMRRYLALRRRGSARAPLPGRP
jgi:undecaprenyl-diphosphatase